MDSNDTSLEMKRYSNCMQPDKVVESTGCELREILSDWSCVLRESQRVEENTFAQLDELLKQAYQLEAECLRRRLETVSKKIEKTMD